MKKFFILMALISSLSYSSDLEISASLISSPNRGALSIAKLFRDKTISTNIHFSTITTDHFIVGAGVSYHFLGYNGPFVFHSSNWMIGQGETSHHFWQLDFGLGFQYAFFKHFGAYAELGFEFYASDGGYYTYYDTNSGDLSNKEKLLLIGLGLIFPF